MHTASVNFSGHQSFALRNTWLPKGVRAVNADPHGFRADDAMVTLGVGKNMVDAIRYWCLATRMLESHSDVRFGYRPSRVGSLLFGGVEAADPYLEDDGTLWLIHYLLATNAAVATTTYYMFNEWSGQEFTRIGVENAIMRLVTQSQARATPNTVTRDVSVFLRTYLGGAERIRVSEEEALDSPLSDLGLLEVEPELQWHTFVRGAQDTLPDAVFLYALDAYWQERARPVTLTYDELAYAPQSPGRVFRLDEPSLAERLERVGDLTEARWQTTETAGFRQITIRGGFDALTILSNHYGVSAIEVTHD